MRVKRAGGVQQQSEALTDTNLPAPVRVVQLRAWEDERALVPDAVLTGVGGAAAHCGERGMTRGKSGAGGATVHRANSYEEMQGNSWGFGSGKRCAGSTISSCTDIMSGSRYRFPHITGQDLRTCSVAFQRLVFFPLVLVVVDDGAHTLWGGGMP